MINLVFTEADVKELNYQRYHHPHPRVQQRMEVLYLKALGILSHEQIAKCACVSPNTMRAYFRMFETGGIEKLKELNFHKPKSELEEYKDTLENHFRKYPPTTVAEASAIIEKLTGVKRQPTQTRKFIKSIGMSLRKVGQIPAKAITEEKKKSRRNS